MDLEKHQLSLKVFDRVFLSDSIINFGGRGLESLVRFIFVLNVC